jgi:hypothetical protein
MTFLRYYLRFENPEIFTKFEEEIAVLTERKVTMGIEEFILDQAKKEAKKDAITEKEKEFTLTLLSSTDFSISKIAELVGVGEDFVLKIKNEAGK